MSDCNIPKTEKMPSKRKNTKKQIEQCNKIIADGIDL